jgi:hypothetical protein
MFAGNDIFFYVCRNFDDVDTSARGAFELIKGFL